MIVTIVVAHAILCFGAYRLGLYYVIIMIFHHFWSLSLDAAKIRQEIMELRKDLKLPK